MDIEREIASFLAETLKVAPAPEKMDPDVSLVEVYGVDSAGVFELILWLEDRFSFRVPVADMDLANFATIRSAAAYVQRTRGVAAREVAT